MGDFPKDVLQVIFCSMETIHDLVLARNVCKLWKHIIDTNITIWKQFAKLYNVRKRLNWDMFPECISGVKTGIKERLIYLTHSEKHPELVNVAARRLAEFNEIQALSNFPGITVKLHDSNLFTWNAYIDGPESTPYVGGKFLVQVQCALDYPFRGPKFQFMIPVYHPEVNRDGLTCIVPTDDWSPARKIISELVRLQVMFLEPNADDPLIPEIAREYKTERQKFDEKAKQWTKMYAMNQGSA